MKIFKAFYYFLVIILVLSSTVQSAVLNVPSEFPTIQEGIDAAEDGDTVLLASGTYTGRNNCDLNIERKAITLLSESGAEHCVLDAQSHEWNIDIRNMENDVIGT